MCFIVCLTVGCFALYNLAGFPVCLFFCLSHLSQALYRWRCIMDVGRIRRGGGGGGKERRGGWRGQPCYYVSKKSCPFLIAGVQHVQ